MAEVIATVMARSAEGALWRVRQAAMAGADWIELRLDQWPASAELGPLLAEVQLPVLATCRTPRDGGTFAGTLAERRDLLQRAVEAGAAGIDLEDWETWEPELPAHTRLYIRSYHCLTGVPPELEAIRGRLLDRGAGLAKVVVTAHDLVDVAPVLDLLAATDQQREPTVAFAMGRAAWPNRLLSALVGAPYVYGSPGSADEAAVGQPPVELLTSVYGVRAIGASTAIYGVVGNPALHSRGPWLHNRVLRQLRQDAIYVPFETSKPEALIAMLPRRRLRGLSVTAPFKGTMVRSCHALDETAELTGVVNTMTFEAHGMVMGHNTDVAGVQGALVRAGLLGAGSGQPAAVLGAGGAARAGAVALARMGFRVTVLARSLDRIRAFARQHSFALASLRGDILRDLRPRVVVHATPVGGAGGPTDVDRLVPDWTPEAGTYVLDMIYHPRQTRLLADAAAAGAVPVSGVEMFLTQAAEQVRLFTGQRPDESELRRFLSGL